MSSSYQPTKGLTSLLSAATNATNGGKRSRFVDFAIELRVVRADASGRAYLAGKPPLRVVRRHRFGGRWDAKLRRFDGKPSGFIVWYVSERQESVLLDTGDAQTRTLLYSAEGGGKSVTAGMWGIIQVVRLAMAGVFVAGGATAPTHERLQTLVKVISERIPTDTPRARRENAIATYYSDQRELRFVTGHVVQFRSTKRASAATGSPVQGYTWAFSIDDELQDSVENGADPDIEARLRGVKVSRRLGTATAKDSPLWRAFRDEKLATSDWKIDRIRFDENPFVWPEHWDRMKRNVSEREWRRRGLAEDVGPERMVYTAWEREKNLRPIPQIGAEDVTAQVMAPFGHDIRVLVSHDPGKLVDVSLFYKAYRFHGAHRHVWFVIGELVTEQTTTEQHVDALLRLVQERWGCNQRDWKGNLSQHGPRIFVRADPYSNSGNDAAHPDRSVYTIFKRAGIQILPAATKAVGGQSKVAAVPKEAGINMVNRLFCDANGERRLFVACDDRRQPLAPKTVAAIEMSERNGDGEAEAQRKDEHDLSHYTANLRYGLWALERPRVEERAA